MFRENGSLRGQLEERLGFAVRLAEKLTIVNATKKNVKSSN